MKTIRVTFEDHEYQNLLKEKNKFKLTWKNFIFMRCLKIRMKGESGKFRA
jgi:hypothetical protein